MGIKDKIDESRKIMNLIDLITDRIRDTCHDKGLESLPLELLPEIEEKLKGDMVMGVFKNARP